MSPLPKKVEKAGIRGLLKKRRPYKVTPQDFFHDADHLRTLYASLVDCSKPDRIVLVPSVSYGMATITKNLQNPGEILLVEDQFPSNVYPWLKLQEKGYTVRFIERPDQGSWSERVLEAINPQTRVVTLSHVHWADGTLFDLPAIRTRLNDVGGLLIVDGTQSIGALPFSIDEIQPDALVCAAYKWLLGPYNIGLAYFNERFDSGEPLEENWINRLHSEDFSQLVNYQEAYQPGALRYEMGEHSNFIALPMLIEGLKLLIKWKPEAIQAYCQSLFVETLPKLEEVGFQIMSGETRSHHLFGLRPPKGLNLEKSMKTLRQRRIHVSLRGNYFRVSPHVYNDERDVLRFLEAIQAISR